MVLVVHGHLSIIKRQNKMHKFKQASTTTRSAITVFALVAFLLYVTSVGVSASTNSNNVSAQTLRNRTITKTVTKTVHDTTTVFVDSTTTATSTLTDTSTSTVTDTTTSASAVKQSRTP